MLHDIMALTRVKKEHLSPAWKEAMKWIFEKDENYDYTLSTLKEVAQLRRLAKLQKPLGDFKPKYIPWTVWRGYAKTFNLMKKKFIDLDTQ